MAYKPQYLKPWEHPSNYTGATWEGWYVFLGQHRDSGTIDRSNFECGLRGIGGETETVRVIRESHWAVGWVEWIGIHESDEKALVQADKVMYALECYPVLNDDHHSALEWEEAQTYWQNMDIRERVEVCQRYGVSIFAARHDCVPQDDNGGIFDYCRG